MARSSAATFSFLLLTAARRNEAAQMERAELSGDRLDAPRCPEQDQRGPGPPT